MADLSFLLEPKPVYGADWNYNKLQELRASGSVTKELIAAQRDRSEKGREITVLKHDRDGVDIATIPISEDAYGWDPTVKWEKIAMTAEGRTGTFGEKGKEKLATIHKFPSFHTCAYYGFFKPDLCEVMGQIPPDLRTKILNKTASVMVRHVDLDPVYQSQSSFHQGEILVFEFDV